MKAQSEFVEACEALAQGFENAGRTDLSALCDRAAYWLDGGDGVTTIPIAEVISSCQGTLNEVLATTEDAEGFIVRATEEIKTNLRSIKADVIATATAADRDALVERAAKMQAIAILTSEILG